MDLDTALKDKPGEGASALDMLRADHAEVRRLFADYSSKSDDDGRKVALRSVCLALELHDRIEREVFYPAVAASGSTDGYVHAHDEVLALVVQLRDRETCDGECDAKVKQLVELVEKHVQREEAELFPAAEKLGHDRLREIGEEIMAHKEDLTRSTREFEGPAT